MSDKIFVDTNLWIYLYAPSSDETKTETIKILVDKYFENIVISTQVLGEFFHVLVRKELKEKEEARQMVLDMASNFKVLEVFQSTVKEAMAKSIRNGYSYWDSLIIAAALDSNCAMLYTEDMQDGQVVEKKLKIINPFSGKL